MPLMNWYRKNKRDLPWRETRDPYKIWVSEVMLQQTTVNAVIPYYDRWVKTFPTVQHVARAGEQKILKMWQGLGYYSRAKNLHKSAKIICQDFAGRLPEDSEQLRDLPGFGAYTTGAVLSIAFDKKFSIVDANVRRVIMRLKAMEGLPTIGLDKIIHEHLLVELPEKEVGTFNQALMELGALICRSKNPLCSMCPLKSLCKAQFLGIQEIIPQVQKKNLIEVNAVVGVFQKGNRFFMQKRPSSGLLADLWEFPGGKIEKGEKPVEALHREIKEELEIFLVSAEYLTKVVHFYTQYKVYLNVFLCKTKQSIGLSSSAKWLTLKDLETHPVPSGTLKILQALKDKIFDK